MHGKHRIARLLRSLLGIALCLTAGPAFAQIAEQDRAAREEAHRQLNIARTFAANARQVIAYDRHGRALRTIGEPDLYDFPQYSPDLRFVAAIRFDLQDESADLWLLDAETGAAVRMTSNRPQERVQTPIWSPSSDEVAYVALSGSYFGIYRKSVDGEAEAKLVYQHPGPIVLADWSMDGKWLSFSASDLAGGRLYVVAADGSSPPILILQAEHQLIGPRFSPDGRYLSYVSDETGRIEYYVTAAAPAAGGAKERWQLSTEGGFGLGTWDLDEPLFYYLGTERRVMAVEVETTDGFEFGKARPVSTVADAVPAGSTNAGRLVTISRDGERLLYALPPKPEVLEIFVLDRTGKKLHGLGDRARYTFPSFSPDGSKVVALREDLQTGSVDVWAYDAAGRGGAPVTATEDIDEGAPVWLAGGEHVAYSYFNDDYTSVYRKRVDGQTAEELLFRYTPGAALTLTDVSTDDGFLAFESFGLAAAVRLQGDDPLAREAIDFLRAEHEVGVPRFSPDARLVAYLSNETGWPEVYLTRFDSATGTADMTNARQVSSQGALGGIVWRGDGRELYFVSHIRDTPELNDVRVMAVSVTPGPELRTEPPRSLFELTLPAAVEPSQWKNVSSDGQRFLFALPSE